MIKHILLASVGLILIAAPISNLYSIQSAATQAPLNLYGNPNQVNPSYINPNYSYNYGAYPYYGYSYPSQYYSNAYPYNANPWPVYNYNYGYYPNYNAFPDQTRANMLYYQNAQRMLWE